jgi:hypothetical protein
MKKYGITHKVATPFDVDRDAWDYIRKKGRDVEVEPPRRMTTRSQTRAVTEDQKQKSLEQRTIAE